MDKIRESKQRKNLKQSSSMLTLQQNDPIQNHPFDIMTFTAVGLAKYSLFIAK